MWCTQTMLLSKQVRTTVTGRWRDAQVVKIPGAYTLLKQFSTTSNAPGAKRPPRMASAFLRKCASIAAVDLIQRRNWISGIFIDLI